jgi:hypothetical protein
MNINTQKLVTRHTTAAQQTQRTERSGAASFPDKLQAVKSSSAADSGKVDEYMKYLNSKYGSVTIQSVGKDQASLDRVGKRMSGSDVIIAPNIFEEMAASPEKAAYYEEKIDYFFNTMIPRDTAAHAAKGLVYEPCGVVVHEDGTVSYICGCGDSPERVAEVNAINKAKTEKKAEQAEALLERGQEAARQRQQEITQVYYKEFLTDTPPVLS